MDQKIKKPIRVLHAPLNYANQAHVLSAALRAIGVDSHLLRYQWEANTANQFYQDQDRVAQISRNDWFGDMLRVVQDVARQGFDIVHLWNRPLLWRYANDFFNGMDLPYVRQSGARIAYRFTGYELRRKSLELEVNPYTPYRYGFATSYDEDLQKRYLDYLAPYVGAFVVQDREMQTYCPQAKIIPRALDLTEFPVFDAPRNARPLVVHAPSQRILKGSDFIIKAVETLKQEGLAFDFVLIEEMAHAEALDHYRRADIIIDQLLVGWYGVLAMEAMAMGKVAIAYIRDDLVGSFPQGLPLINANPDTITAALRDAIKDKELRHEVGPRARKYVEEVHDSRIVAVAAATMYEGMLDKAVASAVPNFGYQLAGTVEFRKRIEQEELERSQARVGDLEKQVAALQDDRKKLIEREKELDEREKSHLRFIEQLKEARDDARWERDFFNLENDMTTTFLRFARRCRARATDLVADAYVVHGVEALLAADVVARSVGGRVYCDVVEMPSLGQRSEAYNVDLINLSLLDGAFEGFLRKVAGISTIGWALKEKLEDYCLRVAVIPNYRYAQELRPSVELRERCGIGLDDRLLLASSTITSGFEPIVESLTLLPSNVHLATLGTFVRTYRPRVEALVERLGLKERVHFFDPVPYERLTTVSSGANVALMAIDASLMNDRVSLPNRLFDCIAAGLPVVTPEVPDIARIVSQRNLGVTVSRNAAAAWAEAIKTALANEHAMRTNALAAAKELVWESLADDLMAAYDHPKSVTIISFKHLTTHQRTIRITETLLKRGVKVTICCPITEEAGPPPLIPGVTYVFTPRIADVPPRPGAAPKPAAQPDSQPQPQPQVAAAPPPAVVEVTPSDIEERNTLEALKQESIALTYKAGRYDELKAELPLLGLQATLFALAGGLRRGATGTSGPRRANDAANEDPRERSAGNGADDSPDEDPVALSPYEKELLQRLQQEIIPLRYKGRRYDALKPMMPLLRKEAALFGGKKRGRKEETSGPPS